MRRLGYEAGGRLPADNAKYTTEDGTTCISMDSNLNVCSKYQPPIPGVFNCRFTAVGSGATKRKKKKPTSFVPPPPNLSMGHSSVKGNNGSIDTSDVAPSGLMSVPFWRRPISRSQVGGSSENEGSAGSRVNIHQKLQEKKQKQLAELKIIEEEIKQGKLGGPGSSNTLGSSDDGRGSLPRQPIPRTKKHSNIEPQAWRPPSPDMCSATTTSNKMFNDLNVMSSTRNYDPIYNGFGLNAVNIPALRKDNFAGIDGSSRNMSPISAGGENNSLSRQILTPRTKIPHNLPRTAFPEPPYRLNFTNVLADRILAQDRQMSMSPRNVTSSPSDTLSPSSVLTHFDGPHSSLFLDVQHPRRISGTYTTDNGAADNLSFPYNVIPPPRSKLDSRINMVQHQRTVTPITIEGSAQQQQQQQPKQQQPTQQQQLKTKQQRGTVRQMQRSKTPEILLSPHYLGSSRVHCDWTDQRPSYGLKSASIKHHAAAESSGEDNDHEDSVLEQNHINASDIDSQVCYAAAQC